jgi:hypothetical protein
MRNAESELSVVQQPEGFVKGHDFSRAAAAAK